MYIEKKNYNYNRNMFNMVILLLNKISRNTIIYIIKILNEIYYTVILAYIQLLYKDAFFLFTITMLGEI